MKHTIRRYGQLEQIDCELGTGYIDINGREIIEGDLVKNPNFDPNDPMGTPVFVVVYDNGESCFVIRDPVLEQNDCTPYPNDPLGLVGYELEIVGHVRDFEMKYNRRINGNVKQIDRERGSGFVDKNGNEVFEGDKVRDNVGNEYTMRKKFYFADKDCAEFDRDLDWYESCEIEIIGKAINRSEA